MLQKVKSTLFIEINSRVVTRVYGLPSRCCKKWKESVYHQEESARCLNIGAQKNASMAGTGCKPRSMTRLSTLSCKACRFRAKSASTSASSAVDNARRNLCRVPPPNALVTSDRPVIPASLSKPEISCESETGRQLGWNCDFSRRQLTDSLNGHAKEADEENLTKRMCHFRGGDSGRVLISRALTMG